MKFKEFMTTVGYLPANVFSGMVNLVLGSTQKDKDGETKTNRGLLGLALDGVKYVAQSTANFIAAHKKAISVAAWLSLAAAGGVGLTLFLWPAALTAVATFSIYGFSIAGIVGANTALQIGFAAGLAAAATSVGTYLTAAVVNGISAITSYFKRPAKTEKLVASNEDSLSDESSQSHSHSHDEIPNTNPSLILLSSQAPKNTQGVTEESHVEPQFTQVFSTSKPVVEKKDQEEELRLSCK
ncbi:transmembrane protein [Legionella gratiana]|uniref:Transmembrane protein n=1 Tax=Legionella gratiana TaxID=45066 RepID=A0A378J0Q3_9GAMM|nr:hypothetical protein [Legionella gratiana]KTD11615.1 transmembrane protein [Legionella gratiana]STX41079.1 transmembrane protein [Legionella gratiana]